MWPLLQYFSVKQLVLLFSQLSLSTWITWKLHQYKCQTICSTQMSSPSCLGLCLELRAQWLLTPSHRMSSLLGRPTLFLEKSPTSFSCQCSKEECLQTSPSLLKFTLALSMSFYFTLGLSLLSARLNTLDMLYAFEKLVSPQNSISQVTFLGVSSQLFTSTYHFCKRGLWSPEPPLKIHLWTLLLQDSFQFPFSGLLLLNKQTKTTGISKHIFIGHLLKSREYITYTQSIQIPNPIPRKKRCSGPPCLGSNLVQNACARQVLWTFYTFVLWFCAYLGKSWPTTAGDWAVVHGQINCSLKRWETWMGKRIK